MTWRIKKGLVELEVVYQAGSIHIEPVVTYAEYERSARAIARSEELLASHYLNSLNPHTHPDHLKAYFEQKGWEVITEVQGEVL